MTKNVNLNLNTNLNISFWNHNFNYVGSLIPEMENGKLFIENSSARFDNVNNLPYSKHGKGYFCRFKLPNVTKDPGVFLWVVDNEVIYVGCTKDLQNSFSFYGKVDPSSYWLPGPSTDCKMNKVALNNFLEDKEIRIYFKKTENYKDLKAEILRNVTTLYNEKL